MKHLESPAAKFILVLLSFTLLPLSAACVKRARLSSTQAVDATVAKAPPVSPNGVPRININTASADELEKLPGVGQGFAHRIVEYREKYGPFRRPEHLIMVRGFSDKRFRAVRDLITVQ